MIDALLVIVEDNYPSIYVRRLTETKLAAFWPTEMMNFAHAVFFSRAYTSRDHLDEWSDENLSNEQKPVCPSVIHQQTDRMARA